MDIVYRNGVGYFDGLKLTSPDCLFMSVRVHVYTKGYYSLSKYIQWVLYGKRN